MKYYIKRRLGRIVISTLLTAILISAFGIMADALTPTTRMSEKYKTSRFYSNLSSLELTSDDRTNVIMVAMSQLGYHEGNSEADFNGYNANGSGNYSEYCYLYGKVDGDGNGTSEYGYAWCAAYVSWCMRQAGIPTSVVKSYVSCTNWVTWFKNNSKYKTRASGYIPQPGDVIFFKDAGVTRTSSHVGIVLYTESGKVYTIEGNSGNAVKLHNYSLSDTYIVGYGVPSYSRSDISVRTDYSRSGRTVGKYIISASNLNVRSTPSTSGRSLGQLPVGTMVDIVDISNGWGKIIYNGQEAWISMSYAYLVIKPMIPATLTFDLDGGSGDYTDIPATVGEKITLPQTIPSKTGYSFLGWSSLRDGEVRYRVGDTFEISADTTLFAVWKANIYTVTFYDHDGTVILKSEYEHGSDIKAPEAPIRESDEDYIYTFSEWDHEVSSAVRDDSFYAVYEAIPNISGTLETDPSNMPSITDIITEERISEIATTSMPSDTAKGNIISGGCSGAVDGIISAITILSFAVLFLIKKRF